MMTSHPNENIDGDTQGTSCSKDGYSYAVDKFYQNLMSYSMDSTIHPLNN